jgi:hypothetical protein
MAQGPGVIHHGDYEYSSYIEAMQSSDNDSVVR